MFDYYSHVNNMTEDQIVKEIERVNNQLFKANPASPIYDQLLGMLHTAEEAYGDILAKYRARNQKDEVLEIGNVSSDVINTKYDEKELLDIVVQSYVRDLKDKKI